MAGGSDRGPELVRRIGCCWRPWRVSEASIEREMWAERDPPVRPHRRIDAEGRPAVTDFEEADCSPSSRRASVPPSATAVSWTADASRRSRSWPSSSCAQSLRSGYATEASWAVLGWATTAGYEPLWATVWDWNTASRRVLAKVGFSDRAAGDSPRDQLRHHEAALSCHLRTRPVERGTTSPTAAPSPPAGVPRVDEVVVVVVADVDLHPVDLAGELAAVGAVVGGDRGAGLVADVGGLVRGEDHRLGGLHPAGADRDCRRSRG